MSITLTYEAERALDGLEEMKRAYLTALQRCAIYEAALEAPDNWAVADVESADGAFTYIPYQIEGFADVLIELSRLLPDDPDFKHSRQPIRPLSFVEIGCGIGRNVNIVKSQTTLPIAKAVGFDIVPEYIETAQKIYDLGEDVFVQDAMTFDYGGYDLIFFYRPFSDDKLERKFENYLIDSVKTGAIIIGMTVERLDSSRKVAQIGDSGSLYKKL